LSSVYLPFHRKYRPSNIADYVGNSKVKSSVMSMMRSEQRPQVLLFQGFAGCGKTTMARLVALEYLCEDRGIMTGACGKCDNCVRVVDYIESGDSGGLMTVREIDIADSNKKQDIDEILEEAAIPTYDGSWRVYILDEFHMATSAAQNRLLKIAEEPPEKVLIVLCTTDPEKILPTIISRCQYTFKVVKPSKDELVELLERVCNKEKIKFQKKALSLICVKGDFVPRKALIVLEQVVREKGDLLYESTLEALDVVVDKYFFDFYELILANPIQLDKYIRFVSGIKKDMDVKVFIENLLAFTLRGIYVNYGIILDALDVSEIKKYKELFSRFDPSKLANLLNLLLNMKTSVDIETRLLLLGYTGLSGFTGVQEDSGYLITDKVMTAEQEKLRGAEEHIKNITYTEEDKKDLVEKYNKPMSVDDLAKMFSGVKIVSG